MKAKGKIVTSLEQLKSGRVYKLLHYTAKGNEDILTIFKYRGEGPRYYCLEEGRLLPRGYVEFVPSFWIWERRLVDTGERVDYASITSETPIVVWKGKLYAGCTKFSKKDTLKLARGVVGALGWELE